MHWQIFSRNHFLYFSVSFFLFCFSCNTIDKGTDREKLLFLLGYFVSSSDEFTHQCSSELRTTDFVPGATGRSGATGITLNDGKIAFIGGEENLNPISDRVEFFNPNGFVWNQISSLNYGREYHQSTVLRNGDVLITGGYDNMDLISTVERFDTNTNTWNYVAPMNQQRALHRTILLLDGRVLAVGGNSNNENVVSGAEFYNPNLNTWTQTNAMNFFRSQFTLTHLNDGRVLAAGGLGSNAVLSSVEVFDPNTNTWSLLAPLNQPRFEHSSILLADGRLLVAGGQYFINGNSNNYLDSMEIYDPTTNIWKLMKMPESRSHFTLNRLTDGSILWVGGRNQGFVNNNFRYIPNKDRWCSITPLRKPRYEHFSTVLPDGSVLIYGGIDASGYARDTERLR
ncbi:Kelch repeat-containing protein [Leptospira mayottensis]|uniref:Kelch repeat-containing protein n=1 Tax=Leptospira mayottensis TaxID=1137606 RepID=UPI000E35D7F3|nr:kelch repeat-containing protein [Leptospira mayottensis]AXR69133.1 galactose oxidase [Leptospira mayottensis]